MDKRIKELITVLQIYDNQDGRLRIMANESLTLQYLPEVQARKADILAYFAAERKAKAEQEARLEAKIAEIEGLDKLRNAINAESQYRETFNRMMDSGSCQPPIKPKESVAELKKRYPRAAAYLLATEWERASHHVKCTAGKRAKDRIVDGDNYSAAIADMEVEWRDYCNNHID